MEKESYIRLVRRVCTAVFVLILLLSFNAHVLATETAADPETVLHQTEDALETNRTATDFSAVAAQLEAVARAEGRSMANRMLYDGLHAVSGLSADMQSSAAAAGSSLSVITVPKTKNEAGLLAWLPYILVAALAMAGVLIAVLRRRRASARRMVYKPMRPAAHSPYLQYTVQHTYR